VHQNRMMRSWLKSVTTASFCAPVLWAFGLQGATQQSARAGFATAKLVSQARRTRVGTERLLTPDDGLAVISAALDAQRHFGSNRDCSHLVHAIYQHAGFPYVYASADDLYDGMEGFRRVFHPQTGDLIVWHGHVGIVVRPSRHVFFSFLSAGPGTDNYRSPYWIGRGETRFYRYVKK
jgi:cell wall-associated NlpC family hydrolase